MAKVTYVISAIAVLSGVFGTIDIAISAPAIQVKSLRSVETTLGGLSMSSSEEKIVERLGPPQSVEEGEFDALETMKNGRPRFVTLPSKWLHYDGYGIYLVDGKIFGFQCVVNSCGTNLGVNVGDEGAKVVRVYGEGNPVSQHVDADLRIR